MSEIIDVFAREILDSRGNPTIEAEVTFDLVWMPLPDRRACRIIGYHPMKNLADKASWPELQAWMIPALEQMQKTFGRRVKGLTSGVAQ